MIKATITVNRFTEIWDMYVWFKKLEFAKVIEIKDYLNTTMKCITIIFEFDEKMIGELRI